jgi:hypothetical protein
MISILFPCRLSGKRAKMSAGIDPHDYLQTDGFGVLQTQKVRW